MQCLEAVILELGPDLNPSSVKAEFEAAVA